MRSRTGPSNASPRSPRRSSSGWLVLWLLLPAILPTLVLAADRDESGSDIRPLDLPSGGPGPTEDEESPPETIHFYGFDFEGDAFVWCLDRSCSMGWAGDWSRLRDEVRGAIDDLSTESEFGLVAFGSGTSSWRPHLVRARPVERIAAAAWLAEIEPAGSSCLLPAGLVLLDLLHASTRPHPVGFIVTDGLPHCGGVDTSTSCLVELPAANVPAVPVHTVYVSSDTPGIEFLQELASRLGGEFRSVEP